MQEQELRSAHIRQSHQIDLAAIQISTAELRDTLNGAARALSAIEQDETPNSTEITNLLDNIQRGQEQLLQRQSPLESMIDFPALLREATPSDVSELQHLNADVNTQ